MSTALQRWFMGTLGKHPNQNNGTFEWEDLLNVHALLNAVTKGAIVDSAYQYNTPSGTVDTITNDVVEDIMPNITESLDAGNKGGIEIKPNTESKTPNTELNNVTDSTNENIEKPIGNDILSFMEEQQKKQWEREDTIRKETQAREDSAYQRTVKDMQAAGINPNLMNVSPAASGGGITNATGLDYTAYTNNLKETLTLLEQEIENTFKEDENKKDRFSQLISSLIMGLLFKK